MLTVFVRCPLCIFTRIVRFPLKIVRLPSEIPLSLATLVSSTQVIIRFSHSPAKTSLILITEKPLTISDFTPHHHLSQNQPPEVTKSDSKKFDGLDRPSIALDCELIISALYSIRTRPIAALRFFRWATRQPGFERSEIAFCAILEILVENDLMRPAYSVMERAIQLNLDGIVDFLISGHVGPDVTPKILDLLIWIYTKKSMVELAISTFYKMARNGFLPDVKNCNRILRILRDGNLLVKARKVYDAIGKFGVRPTVVTFNTMLDSFCKEGKVQEKGCVPNYVTYNVLINMLSKKGELDIGPRS